jgi:4-amino-4-deoxy-L-arabinose transferase-like glycosyltransferase
MLESLKRYRFVLVFVAILLGLVLLRLPSFYEPHWYDDEEIYLTIGTNLAQGARLYADVIDHKPPVLYWWVSLFPSLIWMKISASLFVILSTLLLWRLSQLMKLAAGPMVVAVGVLVLLTNLPALEGNIFNAELMFMPLSLLGMYLWWTWLGPKRSAPKWWQPVAVGICFGAASLVKVPALLDLAALVTFVFLVSRQSVWRLRLVQLLQLAMGVALPWLLVSGYFWVNGLLAEFFYYSLIYNLKYVGEWGYVVQSPVLLFLGPAWIRLAGLLAGLAGLWLARKKWGLSDPVMFVLVWFWWSFFAALLSVRPYPHYYLQMVPALALGAGLLMAKLHWREKLVTAVMLATLPIFIQVVPVNLYRTTGYYTNWLEYMQKRRSETEYTAWFRGIALEHAAIGDYVALAGSA